jgi:DNA end-binding protein Ku
MAARKGVITFGLVSIPVELHVAARPLSIAANLLHAPCQSRIRQQWYCPTCERTVERGELVRGYPVNGGYVVLEDQELDQLETASSRAIDVVEFVDASEVSPRGTSSGRSRKTSTRRSTTTSTASVWWLSFRPRLKARR